MTYNTTLKKKFDLTFYLHFFFFLIIPRVMLLYIIIFAPLQYKIFKIHKINRFMNYLFSIIQNILK